MFTNGFPHKLVSGNKLWISRKNKAVHTLWEFCLANLVFVLPMQGNHKKRDTFPDHTIWVYCAILV